MKLHTRCTLHHPVSDARRNLTRNSVIYAIFAPAAGDVIAGIDLLEQERDVFRIMLEVAIQRDDDVALSFIEASRQSGSLPEIAAQSQNFQVPVGFNEIREKIKTSVGGRVVDKNNLVGPPDGFENGGQTIVEGQDGRL